MYLYNANHYLRPIRREEISQILLQLDADFEHKAKRLGVGDLTIEPYPEQNAVLVYERQKWFDRSFDNPSKDITQGLILYYTLVGTEICTYFSFSCNTELFSPKDHSFGQTKHCGITQDSHFKKLREFTEKLRMLYPDMESTGNDVFYKNNYLLFNSYPSDKKKRFDVAEQLKKVSGIEKTTYHKTLPAVSFWANGVENLIIVRKDCLLHQGIIYSDLEQFVMAFENDFPIRIEELLSDNKVNANFIRFVKENMPLEEFILLEQGREMDEENAKNGTLFF